MTAMSPWPAVSLPWISVFLSVKRRGDPYLQYSNKDPRHKCMQRVFDCSEVLLLRGGDNETEVAPKCTRPDVDGMIIVLTVGIREESQIRGACWVPKQCS